MAKKSKFKIFVTKEPEDRLDCNFNNPLYIDEIKLVNSSKNEKYLLGDVAFVTDGDHGSPQYVQEGIPYFRAINIQNDSLVLEDNLKFISEQYNKNLKKSILKNGDILLVTVGATIGKVAIVKDLKETSNISRDIALIRSNKEKVLPEYLYYFFMSELGQVQIKHFISGALQDGLYLSNLNKILVPIPSISEQIKIINKINEKVKDSNNNLEEYNKILKEIYEYLSGRLFKFTKNKKFFTISSQNMSDRLDCNFYSPELKTILDGLRNIKSKDIEVLRASSLKYGDVMGKEFYENNLRKIFKYLDIGSTNKHFDEIGDYEENLLLTLPTRARQIAKENDVIMPRPIGSNKTILIIPEDFKGQLYSTGFISIKNSNEEEAIIIRGVLKSEIVQKQLFYLQSGSIQPEITPSNFKEYVLVPFPKGKFKEKMIKDLKEDYKKLRYNFQQYKEKKSSLKEDFVELVIKN